MQLSLSIKFPALCGGFGGGRRRASGSTGTRRRAGSGSTGTRRRAGSGRRARRRSGPHSLSYSTQVTRLHPRWNSWKAFLLEVGSRHKLESFQT